MWFRKATVRRTLRLSCLVVCTLFSGWSRGRQVPGTVQCSVYCPRSFFSLCFPSFSRSHFPGCQFPPMRCRPLPSSPILVPLPSLLFHSLRVPRVPGTAQHDSAVSREIDAAGQHTPPPPPLSCRPPPPRFHGPSVHCRGHSSVVATLQYPPSPGAPGRRLPCLFVLAGRILANWERSIVVESPSKQCRPLLYNKHLLTRL